MVSKPVKINTTSFKNITPPKWMTILAAVSIFLIIGPLVALICNIPWTLAWQLLIQPDVQKTVVLSISTATISTLICLILGFPLAVTLHSYARRFPKAATLTNFLIYTPLVLSPVVSGLALIFLWGKKGLIGKYLAEFGIPVAFTTIAVVITQVFVALPFFVSTVITALRNIPIEYEEIAASEGATKTEIVLKVLLPLSLKGIFTGMILSFARALGEYGATLTFAGNIAGVTRTIPLYISLGLNSNDINQALGAVILLLAIYAFVMGIIGIIKMSL